jgi:pantoate--beta-alanine ligase
MSTVISDNASWRLFLKKARAQNKSIGFVPTLGHLHVGHASLLKRCVAENDISVLSIYVNPTQFNDAHDLAKYPRTFETDLKMAEELGISAVFMPNSDTMYPDNFRFSVHETPYSESLEGKVRPGHFSGMLTIVLKLLCLIQPDRAYFGEKDYQQLQLVKDLAQAFLLDTEIIACETVRHKSGLPYSSRLSHLDKDAFAQAEKLSEIVLNTPDLGETRDKLTDMGIEIQYLEDHAQRRFMAVKLGEIRLIDNFSLQEVHLE